THAAGAPETTSATTATAATPPTRSPQANWPPKKQPHNSLPQPAISTGSPSGWATPANHCHISTTPPEVNSDELRTCLAATRRAVVRRSRVRPRHLRRVAAAALGQRPHGYPRHPATAPRDGATPRRARPGRVAVVQVSARLRGHPRRTVPD